MHWECCVLFETPGQKKCGQTEKGLAEESSGTALFSLNMRELKMDLAGAFHYLKGGLIEQMESDSAQICLHWQGNWAITKTNQPENNNNKIPSKMVKSCGRRKSDGVLGQGT